MLTSDTRPSAPFRSPLRNLTSLWGCLFVFLLIAFGASLGLAGAVFVGPSLLGYDRTATALLDEAQRLAATDAELSVQAGNLRATGTQQALGRVATDSALNNLAALVGQTATQSVQNVQATRTADAARDAAQRTQIALDYQATQNQLSRNATQVELDFRQTQAALPAGVALTATPGSFGAQAAPPPTATSLPPTTAPTLTLPPSVIPPPSDTPSPTVQPFAINADFSGGIPASGWQVSAADDWAQNQAARDGAWVLSERSVRVPATFEVTYRPAAALSKSYALLFAVDESGGLALIVDTDSLDIASIGLYAFERAQLDDEPFEPQDLTPVRVRDFQRSVEGQARLTLSVTQTQVFVVLDGVSVLSASLPLERQVGAVGVQFPQDARLSRVVVIEN